MKAKISITAFQGYAVVDECDPLATAWVVSDRAGRSRTFHSHAEACEAAQTYELLGGVPEEPRAEPIMPASHDVLGDRAAMEVLVGSIIVELQEEAADVIDAFPYDAAEIDAIGPLSGGRYLATGEDGLDLYADGDDSAPYLTIPRGLHPAIARRLIDTWEAGYQRGLANGAEQVRRDMRRLLGVSQ